MSWLALAIKAQFLLFIHIDAILMVNHRIFDRFQFAE